MRVLRGAPRHAGIDYNLLAHLPALRARAQRGDFAAAIGSQRAGQFDTGVLAFLNPNVAVVERGGAQLHEHLARGGLGGGNFAQHGGLVRGI